jgi:6-pyruvoyltetrahydropterin/6-carboxytetrahydropterin synthase
MSVAVMRRIGFNAGHRLLGHEGKCANFHGHNYVADFYVTAAETDLVGRVIDFALLKTLLKGWIDEHWDHGMVLSRHDHNGLAAIRMVEPTKYFVLPDNPTAENMARYLLEAVCPELLAGHDVQVVRVVLWESPETCAIVSVDNDAVPHDSLVQTLGETAPSNSAW